MLLRCSNIGNYIGSHIELRQKGRINLFVCLKKQKNTKKEWLPQQIFIKLLLPIVLLLRNDKSLFPLLLLLSNLPSSIV